MPFSLHVNGIFLYYFENVIDSFSLFDSSSLPVSSIQATTFLPSLPSSFCFPYCSSPLLSHLPSPFCSSLLVSVINVTSFLLTLDDPRMPDPTGESCMKKLTGSSGHAGGPITGGSLCRIFMLISWTTQDSSEKNIPIFHLRDQSDKSIWHVLWRPTEAFLVFPQITVCWGGQDCSCALGWQGLWGQHSCTSWR